MEILDANVKVRQAQLLQEAAQERLRPRRLPVVVQARHLAVALRLVRPAPTCPGCVGHATAAP